MTIWLTRTMVELVHGEQLAQHGGGHGVRDAGLLESALARPLNRAGYGEPDLAELAAIYALGIAKNHPFIEGNKRMAYVALETFLALNGMDLTASDAGSVVAMLDMASGEMSDDAFIAWVREHARPAAAQYPAAGASGGAA